MHALPDALLGAQKGVPWMRKSSTPWPTVEISQKPFVVPPEAERAEWKAGRLAVLLATRCVGHAVVPGNFRRHEHHFQQRLGASTLPDSVSAPSVRGTWDDPGISSL